MGYVHYIGLFAAGAALPIACWYFQGNTTPTEERVNLAATAILETQNEIPNNPPQMPEKVSVVSETPLPPDQNKSDSTYLQTYTAAFGVGAAVRIVQFFLESLKLI